MDIEFISETRRLFVTVGEGQEAARCVFGAMRILAREGSEVTLLGSAGAEVVYMTDVAEGIPRTVIEDFIDMAVSNSIQRVQTVQVDPKYL